MDTPANLPYASDTTPFMRVMDGEVEWTNSRMDKIRMCRDGAAVWCAWPGKWRTDLFVVNKEVALLALGDEPYPPKGAMFDDGERFWTVTSTVQGGRPQTVQHDAGSMSFGTAAGWRAWRATVKRIES